MQAEGKSVNQILSEDSRHSRKTGANASHSRVPEPFSLRCMH